MKVKVQTKGGNHEFESGADENLLFAGIVTNGGVASTVRDAHVRDFHTLVLKDGCAAFSEEAHQSALSDLSTVSNLISCEEATSLLRQT